MRTRKSLGACLIVAVVVAVLLPFTPGARTIPANSRKTYSMAEKLADGRASTRVESLTTGKKIMVERAMYWSNRGAGTDTIGGYSD